LGSCNKIGKIDPFVEGLPLVLRRVTATVAITPKAANINKNEPETNISDSLFIHHFFYR
jgi:hypothetical protein